MDQGNRDSKVFSVKYEIKREELIGTLRLMREEKGKGRNVFQTVLAGIAVLLCIIRILDDPSSPLFYILGAVCIALAAASWLMPVRMEARMYNRDVQGVKVQFTLSANELFFLTDQQTAAYILPLDGTIYFRENEDLILVYKSDTRVMAVPKRALNEAQLNLLLKKLQKGAVRRPEGKKHRPRNLKKGAEPELSDFLEFSEEDLPYISQGQQETGNTEAGESQAGETQTSGDEGGGPAAESTEDGEESSGGTGITGDA